MTANTQAIAPPESATSETTLVSCHRPQQEILDSLAALYSSEAGAKFAISVTGKRFVIAPKHSLSNPFARSLFGVVNEERFGTVVYYTFSIKPAVKVIFGIWFALMSVVLLTGITAIIYSGVSDYRLELVTLALAFLAGASGFLGLCSAMSRRNEREMERVLKSIIGDTIAE